MNNSDASTSDSPGFQLKQKLANGDNAYGLWCSIDSIATVEAMAILPVDWILIDCEHGLASAESALPLIQAADRNGRCVLVRVPRLDASLITRVLDAGAHGIMLPRVSNAETARALVAACRYPPQGERGIGPHRATGFYSDFPGYLAHANRNLIVAAQIEEKEAVDNLTEILAVDGIDIAFVGPADLSASLGFFGEPKHPEVEKVVAKIAAQCRQSGTPCGYYCGSGKEAKQRNDQGFQVVNVAQDLGLLVSTARRQLDAARER